MSSTAPWQTFLFLFLVVGAGLLYKRKKIGGDLLFFATGALLIVIGLLRQKEVIHCFANETVITLFLFYLISQILFAGGFFHRLQERWLSSEDPSRFKISLFALLTSFFDQRQILPLLFSKLRSSGKVSWRAASYLSLVGSGMTLIGSVSALFLAGYLHQNCQAMVLSFFFPALISLPLFFVTVLLSPLLGRRNAEEIPETGGGLSSVIWPNSLLVGRMGSKQLLLPLRSLFRRGKPLPLQTLLQTGDYLEIEEGGLSPEQRRAVCLLTPALPSRPVSSRKLLYNGLLYLGMLFAFAMGVPYIFAALIVLLLLLLTRQIPFLEVVKGIAWERILLAISAYMISYGMKNSGLIPLLFPWLEPFSQSLPLFTLLCFVAVTLFSFLLPSLIAIALLFPIAQRVLETAPCPFFLSDLIIVLPFLFAGAFPFFSPHSSDTLSLTLPLAKDRGIERVFPLLLWVVTGGFLYGIASYVVSFPWK